VLIGIDASRATVARRTGTEAYSLHLICGLLELDTEHRFRLYFNQAPSVDLLGDAMDAAGARCDQRVIPFPRLWTHARLAVEMLVRPPDVLFVPSHVLPIVHPRSSVVTVHDLGHRFYPAAHTPGQRRYLEWSTRYHVSTARHLVADSEATRRDLVRYYGADEARVTVVHLGVDPALEPVVDPAELERARAKYGLASSYLLYVGTLQPRKNLVRLIDAFAELCRASEGLGVTGVPADLQLVLAGKKGWLYQEILERGRERGIEARVVLPGFVPEEDLAALYSGASLFVMPSLYEGFCLPALEAMACGTAVACSAASSLPEVVGDAALLFDPHDVKEMALVMARALVRAELRRSLIAQGSERVRGFTWSRAARQVLDVLEHTR
jgi:glycosyltransferase involved in cell wall biosynthesis